MQTFVCLICYAPGFRVWGKGVGTSEEKASPPDPDPDLNCRPFRRWPFPRIGNISYMDQCMGTHRGLYCNTMLVCVFCLCMYVCMRVCVCVRVHKCRLSGLRETPRRDAPTFRRGTSHLGNASQQNNRKHCLYFYARKFLG